MNKKNVLLILIISVLSVLLVSCSTVSKLFGTKEFKKEPAAVEEPVTAAEEVTEEEKEEPEPVIKAEPEFVSRKAEIVLEGNPTTGYKWTVYPDNSGVYEVVSERFEPFEAAEGMVGVGGNYIAELKSIKEGTGAVILEYARGWENAPIKSFKFKITVDSTGRFTVAEGKF